LPVIEKHLTSVGAVLAVVTAIVGTTVTIETRYAKSAEVKAQLEEYYAKQIKLRILEIDLKPQPTPADRALKQYLLQELNKGPVR
jgi:Mn2+/Fe2+ NRAMP family transporter